MKKRERGSAQAIRHRLLEGILLRLAGRADAQDLILRGGMLMRAWFRPVPRPAGDLDLVATYPFSVEETARRFLPLLAVRDVDDGIIFDTARHRVQGIWLNTPFPGVRIFAAGRVAGCADEFSVDVTFGEPLIPAPELGEYAMARAPAARLWMCRPETIVGRKLHALRHMGLLDWRPKDLNDLRLLLTRVPMRSADLPAAIAASFTSRGDKAVDARAVFGPDSWWGMKTSRVRWQDFVRAAGGPETPANLEQVVAAVSALLGPALEALS
ncbi:MAG: nucleotidyl transferase AbiEii/AbiGii toxin family protein [Gemmataceae bacterium]